MCVTLNVLIWLQLAGVNNVPYFVSTVACFNTLVNLTSGPTNGTDFLLINLSNEPGHLILRNELQYNPVVCVM